MIVDEEAFLEHYGKKGMRWGQRRGRDKAKLIGAGVGGYLVGGVASGMAIRGFQIKQPHAQLLTMMGMEAAGATAAVKVTRNILNKKGNVKVPRNKGSINDQYEELKRGG